MAINPSLRPEIGPDGLAREAPVIAYTEKVFFLSLALALREEWDCDIFYCVCGR